MCSVHGSPVLHCGCDEGKDTGWFHQCVACFPRWQTPIRERREKGSVTQRERKTLDTHHPGLKRLLIKTGLREGLGSL